MHKKALIIRDAFKNVLANGIGLPISLFSLLVVARYLGPEQTGITASVITLVLTYSIMLHFATLNALSVRYPYLVGKNTKESLLQAKEMPKTIVSFISVGSLICCIVLLPISAYFFIIDYPVLGFGFIAATILSVLQLFKTFSTFTLRSCNNFDAISNNTFYFFWTPLTFIVVVKFFGLYGHWLAMIFSELFITYNLFKATKINLHFNLNWRKIIKYAKIGFPIFIAGSFYEFFNTSDKLVTLYFLGSTELGNYSVATLSSRIVNFLPLIVATVMWPRIASIIGENVKNSQILKYVRTPTLLLSFTLPFIIGLIYYLNPIIITLILPKYITGIYASQIAIFTIYFVGIMGMYSAYLCTSLKIFDYLTLIIIGFVSFILGLLSLQLFFKLTLENIAAVRVLAFSIMSILTIIYVEYTLSNNLSSSIKSLLNLFLPIIYLLIVIKFLMPLILPFSLPVLGVHPSEKELISIIANQGIFETQFQYFYPLIIKLVTFFLFMTPLMFFAFLKLKHIKK